MQVPSTIIEGCAAVYGRRHLEGFLDYGTDDTIAAFIRGYVACAVTFCEGVDGEVDMSIIRERLRQTKADR